MADVRKINDEFPDDFLPLVLQEFKESAALAIGVKGEMVACPMLAAASVGIGTAATAVVKPGWEEPGSLFMAGVGFKGSGKTPATKLVFNPLEEQQRERERRAANYGEQPEQDEIEDEDIEQEDEEDEDDDEEEDEVLYGHPFEGSVTTSSPHIVSQVFQPPALPLQHLVVHDITQAALWEILKDSQRGVVNLVDELSTVFLPSTAAQRQVLADIYQAGPRTVHRKTSRTGPIILPRTFVSICGGIQPDLFSSIRGKHDGGLLERFLIFGTPETSLPPWSNEVVDPAAETAWNLAIKALLIIEKADYSGSAERKGFVPFTRPAYERLRGLYESLAAYVQYRGIHLKHQGIVRKLVANAARLALIRRCLRWSVGEFGLFGPVGVIEEADCDVACRAAEFFLSRYLLWMPQVLPAASGPAITATPQLTTLADRLLAYIVAKGKTQVEVRWLRQQTLEGNPSTAEIRAALDEAVARGRGRWADAEKKTFVCG